MEIHRYKYNMIHYLRKIILSTCSECKKIFNQDKIKKMKCLCLYCEQCLIKKHNEATNNLKVLNIYELKQSTDFGCNCDKPFNIEEALLLRNDIKEEDHNEAKRRLRDKIKTLCMLCGNEVCHIDQNGKINDLKLNKKIKIADEDDNDDEFVDTRHIACDTCYHKHIEGKEGGKGNDNGKMCVICHKMHHIIISNETGKCNCVIY